MDYYKKYLKYKKKYLALKGGATIHSTCKDGSTSIVLNRKYLKDTYN
jgi:hypothetical protein